MSEILWQDPPIGTRRKQDSRRQRFIQALQGQPGRWAVYPCASSSASGLADGFKKDGLEATIRTVDEVTRLYVRMPPAGGVR